MGKQRLTYVDTLRALAMLLVVLGHTIYFCTYHEATFTDPVFNLICTFHVPLFFFLSGVVVTEPPGLRKFLGKAYRFLLPMLTVGFVNALLIGNVRDFFLNGGHNGYWYLLTLTLFYLMLMAYRRPLGMKPWTGLLADAAVTVGVWLCFWLSMRLPACLSEPLNAWNAWTYWPFFAGGYLCRKYGVLGVLTNTHHLTPITSIAYLVLVVVFFPRLDSLPVVLDFVVACLAIAALVGLFSRFSSSRSWAVRQLTFVGRHTLDIYIYHYFLIRFIDLTFLQTQGVLVQLLTIVPLTLAVTYISIGIGLLVRKTIAAVRGGKPAAILLLTVVPTAMAANSADDNYQPLNTSVTIDRTNLPIMFINTQHQVIDMNRRTAARMTIINNADGTNYGDTLAHPHQTVDYDGWISIRYRGNTSFTYSKKKPYNLRTMATDDPNGKKRTAALMGMPEDHTWALLAPYGDRTMLRDVLVWQLARPYFDYTPRCRYCEVVLDGVYYGVYLLAESVRKGKHRLDLPDPGLSGDALTGGYQLQIDRKEEPHFTSQYMAVDRHGKTYEGYNEIYLQYKHPDYEELFPKQAEYIEQRVNQMENALAADYFRDPDVGYRQYLDSMSFIDQQLSQEFAGNIDGYRLSTNIYKQRDSQDPRFKTVLWDFDLAFGNSANANAAGTDFWRYQNNFLTNTNAYNKVPFWWMRLMEDPLYVEALKARWLQYRSENYSDAHIETTIDSIATLLRQGGALERNAVAWSMSQGSAYDAHVNSLKNWIGRRVAWMDRQLDLPVATGMSHRKAPAWDKHIVGYYNLQGLPMRQPRQGIVVVKYADGSSAKIVIR